MMTISTVFAFLLVIAYLQTLTVQSFATLPTIATTPLRCRFRLAGRPSINDTNGFNVTDSYGATDTTNTTISAFKSISDNDDGSLSSMLVQIKKRTGSTVRNNRLANEQRSIQRPSAKNIGISLVYTGILGLSSFYVSNQWQDLLQQYEWFQTYRYFWCLIGLLYIIDASLDFSIPKTTTPIAQKMKNIDPMKIIESSGVNTPFREILQFYVGNIPKELKVITFLAGFGLVIGGAADAFLPVYVTGPNLITTAGLAPDSAAFLMIVSLFLFTKETIKEYANITSIQVSDGNGNEDLAKAKDLLMDDVRNGRFAGNVLLLSQLYILSCGTFDEIISTFVG